ncbi:MAG: four helix bundle protein [Desulfobia sp.]
MKQRRPVPKKNYINFFHYALKSANESQYWLGLLRDSNKTNKDRANSLLRETVELPTFWVPA